MVEFQKVGPTHSNSMQEAQIEFHMKPYDTTNIKLTYYVLVPEMQVANMYLLFFCI